MRYHFKIPYILVLIGVVASLFINPSCQENKEEDPALITEIEATEIIEMAVAKSTVGIALTIPEGLRKITSFPEICDTTRGVDLEFTQTDTASYDLGISWRYNCINMVIQNLSMVFLGDGTLRTNHWKGEHQVFDQLGYEDFNSLDTEYILQGKFTRIGHMTGNLRTNDSTFNCMTTITLSSLVIDKNTFKIIRGSGGVSVIATSISNEKKAWTGAITIHGDNTATVVINGYEYTFML